MPSLKTIELKRTAGRGNTSSTAAGGWRDVFAFANAFDLLGPKHRRKPLRSLFRKREKLAKLRVTRY